MSKEAMKLALNKAFQLGQRYWSWADSEYSSHWKKADSAKAEFDQLVQDTINAALAEQPEFIKHEVENADDWSEWVCPDPKGYLIKCCDCGLVHEAEFGVVRYQSETEREDCDMVDDKNLQAVFRMRRSEQWSLKDTAHRAGGMPMAEQPAPMIRSDIRDGLVDDEPAQQELGRNHWEDGDVFERIGAMKKQPAQPQPEPVTYWDLSENEMPVRPRLYDPEEHPNHVPLYTTPQAQPAQQQEIDELTAQRDKLADILTRTANALKGQPAELSSHSWHDLPEVAQQLKAAQQQEPEYKGWYCAHCQRGVDGSEVTYHEQHTVCGRVITDDLPPKAQQEPVGEITAEDMGRPFNAIRIGTHFYKEVPPVGTKLYTSPPAQRQRSVKPLTDEEIQECWYKTQGDAELFARAIEAAHGITENT